jgi:hypothetical protein
MPESAGCRPVHVSQTRHGRDSWLAVLEIPMGTNPLNSRASGSRSIWIGCAGRVVAQAQQVKSEDYDGSTTVDHQLLRTTVPLLDDSTQVLELLRSCSWLLTESGLYCESVLPVHGQSAKLKKLSACNKLSWNSFLDLRLHTSQSLSVLPWLGHDGRIACHFIWERTK